MAKKFYNSEKFQEIFYPILYIILAICFVVSGLIIFYNRYYTSIYVHGSSMMPTLLGGYTTQRVHYGIADKHDKAIGQTKRFDVMITYYPSSWIAGDEDTTYKIKRVWGFPGETISMTKTDEAFTFTVIRGELIVEEYKAPISNKTFSLDGVDVNLKVATFQTAQKSFNVNVSSGGRTFTVTLSEEKQEYFLMGDNWVSSSDSYTHLNSSERITRTNVQGKVVCIQGTAVYNNEKQELQDKKKIKAMYYF